MKDTDESIYIKISGLQKRLEERKAELTDMIERNIKYQHMQGTKDDIYRLHREIAELRNSLSKTG
tara:strand:+ start:3356 stop:3550 length:195 start_codon:yes stop_codon:yes gene_type:complete